MRILITGDRHWRCDDLAEQILNRLHARYGPGLTIGHGGAPVEGVRFGKRFPKALSPHILQAETANRICPLNYPGLSPSISSCHTSLYTASMAESDHSAA